MSATFPIDDDPRFRVSTATEGQTAFTVPFPFQGAADIAVWREDLDGLIHVLELGVDYLISGAGLPAGGTVTLTIGAIEGERIYRVGQAVLERKQSVVRNGKFSSEALDQDLDRTIISLQEFRRDVARSWVVAFGQQAGTIEIGPAGRSLIYDVNGNVVPGPAASDIASAQANAQIAAAAEAYVRSMETRLTIVALIEADVTTVAQVASHVPVVASIADDVETNALIAAHIVVVSNAAVHVQTVSENIDAVVEAAGAIPDLAAKLNKDGSNANEDAFWAMQPFAVAIGVSDDLDGSFAPPTDNPNFRYAKLTADDPYNAGILINESVSGSAPNLTAVGTVDLPGARLHGKVLSLINTDRRFIRAGNAGTKGQSQNLSHDHEGRTTEDGLHNHQVPQGRPNANSGAGLGYNPSGFGSNTSSNGSHRHILEINADGGDEARPAYIGATYYIRIK
jgi:hypothetical protein